MNNFLSANLAKVIFSRFFLLRTKFSFNYIEENYIEDPENK